MINASKPYITFRGDGLDKTIIQWGDQAGDFDDDDQMLKTYRSATVGVSSQYFIAENIQFRVLILAATHQQPSHFLCTAPLSY